jgi:hypothetical protein
VRKFLLLTLFDVKLSDVLFPFTKLWSDIGGRESAAVSVMSRFKYPELALVVGEFSNAQFWACD